MRKIKFRAFIDGEYMVFSDMSKTHPYDDDEIIWIIQGGLQISTLELINEIVGGEVDQREAFQIRGGKGDEVHFMQFTGLTDKNGVDIYEGDIIDDKFDCGQLRIISWNNDKACFVGIEIMKPPIYKNMTAHSYPIQISPTTITEGKVIGNIFENKELIDNS